MMEHETDLDDFRACMRDLQEDGTCVICLQPFTFVDHLDIPWCTDHRFRGEFLNRLAEEDWPPLLFDRYAIGAGIVLAITAILYGTDDCIGMASAAIDIPECRKRWDEVWPQRARGCLA